MRRTALACTILILISAPAAAQEDLGVIEDWLGFSDVENTLYRHLTETADRQLRDRERAVRTVRSRADWTRRQQEIRARLREAVGPFPERTPLRIRTVRTLERDGYRIEHLIYESVPGFHVTGSLFVPEGLERPAPAILYLSGHTDEAYRSETYQHVILNLVGKGFVVLAIDPIGQGERLQYPDTTGSGSVVGGPTDEHSYVGAQSFLTGRSPAWIFTWDGMRALDVLERRPEVDPDRLGVTGRSGGGTQTAFLAAMDERVRAAAPENYITSYHRLLQSIGPQDAEQNVYHGLAQGLDHADFLTVRAPAPTLMITTTRDFFSIQGARETAREVRRTYGAFGAEDRFRMVEDDGPHTSTEANRQAMYAFFQKHLGRPGPADDRPVETLPAESLQVTETGQVVTSLSGRTAFDLVRERTDSLAAELAEGREGPPTRLEHHLAEAVRSARSLSGYRSEGRSSNYGRLGRGSGSRGAHRMQVASGAGPGSIFTGRHRRSGYLIEEYVGAPESELPVPYLLALPDGPGPHPGLLYLHPEGKGAEAGPDGEIARLASAGYAVLAPDLAGRGETGPGELAGDYEVPGLSYSPWMASVITGRSIAAVRAEQIAHLARRLADRPEVRDGPVAAYGRGTTGPTLLHAAAFSDRIGRVGLAGPLRSYEALTTREHYDPSLLPTTVPGALTGYDLPDLAASLSPSPLLIAGPVDAAGQPADEQAVEETYGVVRRAYAHRSASSALRILAGGEGEAVGEQVLDWLTERR